ncbi:MAG: CHC2 zinc finger domain-containing protein [Clostridium paraputrificum]
MFDLNEIKNIPILDICSLYNITLEKKGKNYIGKIRNEKTPSCVFYVETNTWKDFGINEGGSTIDLVMKLEGVKSGEAMFILADRFNLKKDSCYSNLPTNQEFKEIGINPDRAIANFVIDLETQSLEKIEEWEQKYSIPMRDLYYKNKVVYSKILRAKALPLIYTLRRQFEDFRMKYAEEEGIDKELYRQKLHELEKMINSKVDIYNKGRSKKYRADNLKVEFKEGVN